MSSNLSSLLLGGLMNAAGPTPPDKKPETSPTPPAGGGFDFTQFATGSPNVSDTASKVHSRMTQPLTGLASGRAYKENMPLATKAAELIKRSPSSIDSHLRQLGSAKFATGETPTDLHVFGHRYSGSKNTGLQSAMRDAFELYTRALSTPVGANGFSSAEEKTDAIKHAAQMVEKLNATKDDANPVDYDLEHSDIKRNLVHARQDWRKDSGTFANTQSELNKSARDENAQNKRRAVGTLIKHFVDREHNDILGINKSAAIAHADLIKLQAYLGKNPTDVTIDEFIDTPIGRSLVESIGDRLDSVGAWDYPAGQKLLKRIKAQSADSKAESDKIAWGRQQLSGLGEPTPGEDAGLTAKREQFKTAINNSEELLRDKQTPLGDEDFADFGGKFRVGQDVRSRLRPSNPDRILKSDLTGEDNTPSNRGKYGAGVRNWEADVRAMTEAIRATGGDVTSEQVKAASERLGKHGPSQFLGTMLGATSRTPVPYIGEHGQQSYTFSGLSPENQMSEQDIAQQSGQSNTRLTGYGDWGTKAKFQGSLLAGLGLTDQQLNDLAGKAGIKNPDQINDFKEAARRSAAAANTNAALERLHDLMQITDEDANGNKIAVQTNKRGIVTFGGQIGSSTSAMLERLHEMNISGETNNRDVSVRHRVLSEAVGSAYGELTRSNKGARTSGSWEPFAIGEHGVNPWAPVTHKPSPAHSVHLIGSMLGVSKDNSQYRADVNKLLDYVIAKANNNDAGTVNTNIRMSADTFNSDFKRTARHIIKIAETNPGIRDEFLRAGLDGLEWSDSNKFIAQLAKFVQEPNNARRIEGLITRTADQHTRNIPPVRGTRNLSSPTENKAVRNSVNTALDNLENKINTFVKDVNKAKVEGIEGEDTQADADGNETKVKKIVYGTDPEFAKIIDLKRQQFIEDNRGLLSSAFTKAFMFEDDKDLNLIKSKEALGGELDENELAKRDSSLDNVVNRYLDYASAKINSLLNPDDANAKASVADLLKKANSRTGLIERKKTQKITDKEASARGAIFLSNRNLNAPTDNGLGFWNNINRNRFDDLQREIGHLEDSLGGIAEADEIKAAQQEVDRLSKISNPDTTTKNSLTLAQDKVKLLEDRLKESGQGRLAYRLEQAQAALEKKLNQEPTENHNAKQIAKEVEVAQKAVDKVTKEIADARKKLETRLQDVKNLLSPDLPHSKGGPLTEADYRANQNEHFRIVTNDFDRMSPDDQKKYWDIINSEWKDTGKKPEGLPFQVVNSTKLNTAQYDNSKHAIAHGFVAVKDDNGEYVRPEVPPMFSANGKRNPAVRIRNVKDSDGNNHIFLEHVSKTADGRETIAARQEVSFDFDPTPPSKTITDSDGNQRPNPQYKAEYAAWEKRKRKFDEHNSKIESLNNALARLRVVDENTVKPAIDALVKDLPNIARKTIALNTTIKSAQKELADYVAANVNDDAFKKWASDNHKDISTDAARTKQLIAYGAVKDVLKGAQKTAYNTRNTKLIAASNARSAYHSSVGLSPKVAAEFQWNSVDDLIKQLDAASSDNDKKNILESHPGFPELLKAKINELKQFHYAKAVPYRFKNNDTWHQVKRDLLRDREEAINLPHFLLAQGQLEMFRRHPAHILYTNNKGGTIGGLTFEEFSKKMTDGLYERRKEIDKSYTHLAHYINNSGYQLPNGEPLRVSTINNSNGKEGRQTLADVFKIIDQHGPKYWHILSDAMHDGYDIAHRGKMESADAGRTHFTEEMRAFDEQLIRDAEAEMRKRQQYTGKKDPQFQSLLKQQAANRAAEAERLAQDRVQTKQFPPESGRLPNTGHQDWMRAEIDTEGYSYNGRYVKYNSREYKDLIKRATPVKDAQGKITAQDPEAVKELRHAIISQSERIYVKRGEVKQLRPGSQGVVWIPASKDHPERLLPVGSQELKTIETNQPHLLNGAYLVKPGGVKLAMQVIQSAPVSQESKYVRLPSLQALGISSKHPMAKYAGQLVREGGDEHQQLLNIVDKRAHTIKDHTVTAAHSTVDRQISEEWTNKQDEFVKLQQYRSGLPQRVRNLRKEFNELPTTAANAKRRAEIIRELRNAREDIRAPERLRAELLELKKWLDNPDNKYVVKARNVDAVVEKRKTGVHGVALNEENQRIAQRLLDESTHEDINAKKGYATGRIDDADKPLPKDGQSGKRQKVVYRNQLLVFLTGLLTAGRSLWKGLTED